MGTGKTGGGPTWGVREVVEQHRQRQVTLLRKPGPVSVGFLNRIDEG